MAGAGSCQNKEPEASFVSQMWMQRPKTWANFCCFLRHINREMGWKWSSCSVVQAQAVVGCKRIKHRQWLIYYATTLALANAF